jgi:hypothetical protein
VARSPRPAKAAATHFAMSPGIKCSTAFNSTSSPKNLRSDRPGPGLQAAGKWLDARRAAGVVLRWGRVREAFTRHGTMYRDATTKAGGERVV